MGRVTSQHLKLIREFQRFDTSNLLNDTLGFETYQVTALWKKPCMNQKLLYPHYNQY